MRDQQNANEQLKSVATRLTDIAAQLSQDAEAVTATIRAMSTHAHEIAALANDLEGAANHVDMSVQAQADTLTQLKRSMTENEPAIDALAHAIETVASMSGVIDEIARQSRVLSLNARIEAMRGVQDQAESAGFAAVASEMSLLTEQTRVANEQIRLRVSSVTQEVERVRRIVKSGDDLMVTQTGMIGASLDMSHRLRTTASMMTRITAEAATKIDNVAAGIGRMGSTAAAVKILAQQISRIVEGATASPL